MQKLTKRKGFNFFRSYYDVYNELSDADKVAFMDALLDRQFLGIKPENLEGMAKFAYISQTNSIDSQVKGYEDKTGIKLNPTEPPTAPPTDGGNEPPSQQVEVKEKGKVKEKEQERKNYSEAVIDCFNDCLKHFSEHLHPSTQKQRNAWLDTIEKLNRIEKLPFGVIVEITEKTRQSDFWAKNFLSLTKLRKTNKDGIKYIVVFNEHIKNQTNGTGTKLTRAEEIRQHNAKVAAEILGDKRNG